MREMKDSGKSFIGIIPSNWEVSKLKYLGRFYNGDRGKNYPSGSDIVDEGIYFLTSNNIHSIVLDSKLEISKFISQERYALLSGAKLKYNDIVFCLRGSVGNCAINKDLSEGTVASSLMTIRIEKASPDYINYVLHTHISDMQTYNYTNGSCAANLSAENVINYYSPLPSLSEQRHIASVLDAKCTEIDALTADIQAQIDTLEQYKRSVITEAVTKGLNPNAEMKNSGAGWMPRVPTHWAVDKLKYHLRYSGDRNPGECEVLSLYRELGVVPKESRDDNHNVTSEDTTNYKYVRIGDFVVNKMKAWQGSVAVSNYEGIVSPAYFVYRFTDDAFDKQYFHYLLRNRTYAAEFMRLSGGIRVGQWDLPASALENIFVLLPPKEEQKAIAGYLNTKCAEIDETIEWKREQLNTIEEYKKSLIFEYVTGKKEV